MSNLKQLRKSWGLTLEIVANDLGTSKSQIFDLERERSNPTIKTAYAIADYFGVAVQDIWPNTPTTDRPTNKGE